MSGLNLNIGDYVHYGAHGVCLVSGKEQKEFRTGNRDYFLLQPTGEEAIRLYLPADAEPEKVKLRKVLSEEEIYALVEEGRTRETQWIRDSKQRRETLGKVLRNGDAAELIQMVRAMYFHEKELPEGKTLPISDMELEKKAEKLLYNEFHYVLNMPRDEVIPFIIG